MRDAQGHPETLDRPVLGIREMELHVRVWMCRPSPVLRSVPAASTNKDVKLMCVGN